MPFPTTPKTLIQRLAAGGSEDDWKAFSADYWGPVCRFALRWGAGNLVNAEEVAAETFNVVWEKQLLARWAENRSARFRNVLAKTARYVLANRLRADKKRPLPLDQEPPETSDNDISAIFYGVWVEDVVSRAVDSLAADYHRQGKGDYFRVLYGRIVQGLTIEETARLLNRKASDIDNYFRHAKKRLEEKFEEIVRKQASDYFDPEEAKVAFADEWRELGAYLVEHGGLEQALKTAYATLSPEDAQHVRQSGITAIVHRSKSDK